MIKLAIVEDNIRLRPALKTGLNSTKKVEVIYDCGSGEEIIDYCHKNLPDVILMDVQLSGKINGITSAINIRREFPRLPIVFYSIQDNDTYYREFLNSGILTHYAYVKKSNYLLPQMIVPLLNNSIEGFSFIDPEIAERVEQIKHKDINSPMSLLEPNEQEVIKMVANGMTNQQIANKMGFRDKRTISRINGQIYSAWGLNRSTTDEKVARSRAIIIYQKMQIISWDKDGLPWITETSGKTIPWKS